MRIFISFSYHFFLIVRRFHSVFLSLIALMVSGAAVFTYTEKMPFDDALYFSFVTGLTIGYGDIVVKTPVGRILAVLIGFIGVLFSGMVIAVAVRALRESYQESEKRG